MAGPSPAASASSTATRTTTTYRPGSRPWRRSRRAACCWGIWSSGPTPSGCVASISCWVTSRTRRAGPPRSAKPLTWWSGHRRCEGRRRSRRWSAPSRPGSAPAPLRCSSGPAATGSAAQRRSSAVLPLSAPERGRGGEVMPYLAPDPPLTLFGLPALVRAGREHDAAPDGLFFASGRAALLAGLRALGIGAGDEVLLPAYLCESVVTPVVAVRARPVFFPVGKGFDVDLAAIEAAIGPRTRAVVLIHYLGFPGPVEAVREVCRRRGVALIEDCAHALFSRDGDRLLGSFGDLAIFSPWKSLPLPDGGLLRVNRPDLRPSVPAHAAPARR